MSTPSPSDQDARIQSYQEFWPYYLAEHSVPLCRHVHFIGTTGFVLYLGYLIKSNYWLGGALMLVLLIGYTCFKVEAKQNAFWALLGMIGVLGGTDPSVFYGVLFAYFWAWVGHFLIEHNRPATFSYPLWSLASDFKMWLDMCPGRRWSGPKQVEL